MDLKTHKVYTSRYVRFIENDFPFSNSSSPLSYATDWPSVPLVFSTPTLTSRVEQQPPVHEVLLAPLHILS